MNVGAVAVRRDEVVKIHLGSGNNLIGSGINSIRSEYDLRDQI